MGTSRDIRLESKLGFDRVRKSISDRCKTQYAAERVENEEFSTDANKIKERLLLTDEMRLIMMFEDSFPVNGYIDCIPFLEPLGKEGSNIDLLSLGKLRTLTDTMRKIKAFFASIKDGVYPNLKRMSASIEVFPEVSRRIDIILDRFGNVKDTASEHLYEIRKSLKEKESSISRLANSILKRARARRASLMRTPASR